MVFSDTGTAGLNVRVLLDNQIFIASGPGIRITDGNEYAHLALLNSRLASYCVRIMSPKHNSCRIHRPDTYNKKYRILSSVRERCKDLHRIEEKNYYQLDRITFEYNSNFLDEIPRIRQSSLNV